MVMMEVQLDGIKMLKMEIEILLQEQTYLMSHQILLIILKKNILGLVTMLQNQNSVI